MFSYSRGPVDPPLLESTIGDELRRTVERFGGRDALVVRHQGVRLTYRECGIRSTWRPAR
jgi:fatty-acyl-CoA synthase